MFISVPPCNSADTYSCLGMDQGNEALLSFPHFISSVRRQTYIYISFASLAQLGILINPFLYEYIRQQNLASSRHTYIHTRGCATLQTEENSYPPQPSSSHFPCTLYHPFLYKTFPHKISLYIFFLFHIIFLNGFYVNFVIF